PTGAIHLESDSSDSSDSSNTSTKVRALLMVGKDENEQLTWTLSEDQSVEEEGLTTRHQYKYRKLGLLQFSIVNIKHHEVPRGDSTVVNEDLLPSSHHLVYGPISVAHRTGVAALRDMLEISSKADGAILDSEPWSGQGLFSQRSQPSDINIEGDSNANEASSRPHALTRNIRKKARWAISDKDKFELLVSELRYFNDSLYDVLPLPVRQYLQQAAPPSTSSFTGSLASAMLKIAKGEIELEGAENTATTAETANRALAFYTATDTGPSALLAGDESLLNGVPLRKTSAKTSRTYSTAGWRTLLVYCTRRPASSVSKKKLSIKRVKS
ncbi:hypothetical protein F5882DRAFT_473938, partial [Hyaloscypha sp. PMI_1271]